MKKVLIIDDDRNILTTLRLYFEREKFQVFIADSGLDGIEQFTHHIPELVLLDMRLPDITGLDVLRDICAMGYKTYIVVITAHASIETAVEAMKIGAFDYLPKPFIPKQIDLILEKLKKFNILENKLESLKGIFSEGGLLTRNRHMQKIIETARQAADSNINIIISGESGTGKGLLAKLIHSWSPRSEKPFVVVDCTSFQESFLESDLFGHVKGAFTGALKDKDGKLKIAENGTAFLDEISEVPYSLQKKLLRFIQSREYERLGDPKTYTADVRILVATNRDLEELVQEGAFRKDLFFRLNVVELFLPPLRERPEDIQLIAERYLDNFSKINSKGVKKISLEVLIKLKKYNWPGNIRELVNCIERGVVLSMTNEFSISDLPPQIVNYSTDVLSEGNLLSLEQIEKRHLQTVIQQTTSYDEAARILDIDPATLWRKRKKHHLD